MPSLAHHSLVTLFRERPELALGLLRDQLGVRLPRPQRTRIADATLDTLHPVERRADLVIELCSARGRPVLAIVLEVQRRRDARKRLTWAEYLVLARRRCRACVLVVATDASVAAWAARPIDLGPGNEALHIWVLGPDQIRPITDVAEARADPFLAMFSALAHADRAPETLAAAVHGLPSLPHETAQVVYNVLLHHLGPTHRTALETLTMEPLKSLNLSQAETARILRMAWDSWRAEQDVLRERKDRRERLATTRDILLRLLRRARMRVSAAQKERITGCRDLEKLNLWIDRVLDATSTADVLGAPAPPRRARRH